jgi:hypothetical protein
MLQNEGGLESAEFSDRNADPKFVFDAFVFENLLNCRPNHWDAGNLYSA